MGWAPTHLWAWLLNQSQVRDEVLRAVWRSRVSAVCLCRVKARNWSVSTVRARGVCVSL